jgi:hypothetical protein
MAKQDPCRHATRKPSRDQPTARGRTIASTSRSARWTIAACAIVLTVVATPSSAEWLLDADAGALFDSNLTRAPSAPDIRPDWAATFDASAGQFFALTGEDGLALTLNVRGETYDRYKGLNVAAIGASAVYRHKFGLGWGAPWAALAVNGSYDEYRTDLRTGARFDLRAEVGRRFTESIEAVAGVAYDRRFAPHGEPEVPGISGKAFELTGQSAYFRVAYAIDEAWLLGVDGSIRRGDVESTSQQSLAVFLAASAIAEDPAFNEDELYAYRLRGTTSVLGATLSWALSDRSSLNFHYRFEVTHSPQDLEYRSYNTGLAFAYRF